MTMCRDAVDAIAAPAQFELNGGEPVGASIPATEHSVMTAWETERAAIENMIVRFGDGLFACVMDSYDYMKVSPGLRGALDIAPTMKMSWMLGCWQGNFHAVVLLR